MIKKLFYLTFVLFLFFAIKMTAQENTPTEKTINDSAIIKYSNQSTANSNLIIKKLKESFSGNIQDLELQFVFNQIVSIRPVSAGSIVSFQLINIQLKNKFLYKGFNITNYLIPNNVSISCEFVDKNNQKITEFESNKVSISKNNSKRIVFNYNGFEHLTIEKIVSEQYFFDYSNKAKQKFDSRVKLVDEYYNFSALMNLEIDKINEIDLKNIDELVNYRNQLEKTKKFIKKIENKNFVTKLELNKADPADFLNKLKTLKITTKKYEEQVNYALSNMHVTYYKRGLIYLEQHDTVSAKKYFLKSIEVKSNYVPSWLKIAEYFEAIKQNDSSAIVLLNVFYSMHPTQELQEEGIKIASRVGDNYLIIANSFNKLEKYDSAMVYLLRVSKLCKNISKTLCDEKLYNEYTLTHTGIYGNMLSQIKTYINENKFVDAEFLIDSAVVYKNKNNYYITIKDQLIPLITVLYNKVIKYAGSMLNNEAFIQANRQYIYAEKLCKKYVVIQCEDEIYSGIKKSNQGIYEKRIDSVKMYFNNGEYKQAENLIVELKEQQIKYRLKADKELPKLEKQIFEKYYLKNINDAQAYISVKKYDEAVNLLIKANKLQNEYNLPKIEIYDSLFNYSTGLSILTELKKGKRRAAENKINEAKRHYSIANAMVENYHIKMNDELKNSFNDLKSSIFSQKCKNAQLDYDVQKNTAIRFIKEGKYIEADNALIKSIRISDENSECQILTKEAIQNRDKIRNIVYFQKKLIKINNQIKNENYQDALINYIDIEHFYNDSNINEKSGLTLQTLDEFISNNENGFINYAVKYFAENNELDLALKYLNLLYKKGYPAKWTEINQNLLGNHLAIKDYKGENVNAPKVFVKQYIADEKWFKYMRKSYLSQCKKLR